MSKIIRVRYAFYAIVLMATWLVKDHPFFWDTVQLGSKQAHFFYENGFSSFILPVEIDSGHPPFFGAYLALMWQLFGKTLAVSHFAMLPFLLGNVYLLQKWPNGSALTTARAGCCCLPLPIRFWRLRASSSAPTLPWFAFSCLASAAF